MAANFTAARVWQGQRRFACFATPSRPARPPQDCWAQKADERREERFYWICARITLIDLATFPHLGFVAVICIFLIQIVALAALARKYADENIAIAIDKIIASICDRFGWK
ncbi:hypothetical protein U7859_00065 [Bradyrhizobium ottawaense]|uniref:hypothetical protein n=1 Tax=Bradyrhizobium ottawaense TaxID=931866 RepID=UPI002ADF2DBB|nr:hypothetical protein [Bradyrhizobium ottawaense]WQN82928.1 hypothetical protein U7859_00065 [Bradyrhizobium ottawaense]